MTTKIIPTKAALLKVKSSLQFAKKGYELLDKKRMVLIREMMELNKIAGELQSTIEEEFVKIYEYLEDSSITMGTQRVYELSKSIKTEDPFEINFRSVMGVELPKIKFQTSMLKAEYGIHESTSSFDRAAIAMNSIRELIYQLAEVESGVFRLAIEIKKTQKRANALDKIQIPKYQEAASTIESVLEEKEREDFFRLKKVKSKKRKKCSTERS